MTMVLARFILGVALIIMYGFRQGTTDIELMYLSIIGIILHGKTTLEYDKDAAEESIGGLGTIWQLSHFVFYALLGYIFPNQHLKYAIYGVAWEMVESFVGTHEMTLFGKRVFFSGIDNENSLSSVSDGWWYGSASDVAYNNIGYMVGNYLHDNLGNKNLLNDIAIIVAKDAKRVAPGVATLIASVAGLHVLLMNK